jgi:hypothetical protein
MPSTRDTERDRYADHRDHRKRRAAARVTVHLGQHDPGDADLRVELAGALDRVLPGHRVGNEQQIRRLGHTLDRDQLRHQLVVDVQPARGVHDHRIEAQRRRLGHRALRARHRIHHARRIVDADAGFLRDHVQLLNRGGTLHVRRHQQGVFALLLQPRRQLARRRRLARALETEHQDDARPRRRRLQTPFGVAEERHHLVADDLDDFLRRTEPAA